MTLLWLGPSLQLGVYIMKAGGSFHSLPLSTLQTNEQPLLPKDLRLWGTHPPAWTVCDLHCDKALVSSVSTSLESCFKLALKMKDANLSIKTLLHLPGSVL